MIHCIEGLSGVDEYIKGIIFAIEVIEQLFDKINHCVSCADSPEKLVL